MVSTLSDYQCECANPNAVKTPQTYKQGPVVRLDQDVREVQKWTGANPEGKGAASMNRETRTALRDKVADYQKQNGIDSKTSGELNQATLDKMKADKSLPQGLTDSLQKVNPYYKPDGIPRIICTTKPGEKAPEAAQTVNGPGKNPELPQTKQKQTEQADVRRLDNKIEADAAAAREKQPTPGNGPVTNLLYRPGIDPAPTILRGPVDVSKPQQGARQLMSATGADGYMPEGKVKVHGASPQPEFKASANDPSGIPREPQVQARLSVLPAEPAAASPVDPEAVRIAKISSGGMAI